jgi:hypothetical protein
LATVSQPWPPARQVGAPEVESEMKMYVATQMPSTPMKAIALRRIRSLGKLIPIL